MPPHKSATHYGAITRFLQWAVFLLFVHQYLSGNFMVRLESGHTLFGMNQNNYYDWHKSTAVVLLMLAVLRIVWR